MIVRLNGAEREVADGTTVDLLVRAVTGSGRGSAVVVDGTVVPRSRWPEQVVRAGSDIELITAVQGG